jgi:catechol 2,3-dioxygenase-like lactoylglutathione lyase family enzyme
VHLYSVTFDSADPPALARFWSDVTGYPVDTRIGNEFFAQLSGDGSVGPRFMFIKVPEGKTAKNRMHVDLGTSDLDVETERILGLGAEFVGKYEEWGATWATFRDPEGNEFCIGLHEPLTH